MNRFDYCLGNTTHLCDSGRQKLIQQVKLDSGYLQRSIQLYVPNVLWVAFSIPSDSLLLLNYLV
jgi:hypothetical protein